MLLNLYPTPIHKSAITNSLSRVLRAGVLISSQLFVRTVVGPQHSTGQLQFQQQLIQSDFHHPLRDTADTLQILEMSGLEDLGPLPEGWTLKWHGVGNTRRP